MLTEDKEIWIKKLFLVVTDIGIVFISGVMSLLLRFDFVFRKIPVEYIDNLKVAFPFLIVSVLIVFSIFRLYSSLWSFAGIVELLNIIAASMTVGIISFLEVYLINRGNSFALPRSFFTLFVGLLGFLTFLNRYAYRGLRFLNARQISKEEGVRVLIIGAGAAGNTLIKEIRNSQYIQKQVVGVIDDNCGKIGNFIHGVKIIGGRNVIENVVRELHVQEIIVAMPSASTDEIRAILDICKKTGCELKRLPGIYQLVNGEISISKLKQVDVVDLLGRDPIEVDLSSILGCIYQKVVMITGGGGSIGSELCRQIADHEPKQLIIIDIYENTTYDIQNELVRKYPGLDCQVLIASVRNTKRIDLIFEKYKPDIVYHAAAHKHVPLMEKSPNEAVKNNVLGTWKVVDAASKWGVKRFVMISTDKAVNPTNIMGATKRICEMIIQVYNQNSKTEYVAVRFGNVLGSNGSVIPLFCKQIEKGGPVTVTHPEITRYFMTIPEAVSLVLQAGAYAKGGEIFILDMGEPVKILDLAQNLIFLTGNQPDKDIRIEFTGLRPGEKLYEEMLMKEEGMQSTPNKKIFIGKPIELDEKIFLKALEDLKEYVLEEPDDIREHVQKIVSTYKIQA